MGEALYRKYRPKKLTDVVGQPHITSTISNALNQNRISHGYLFSGPRGVGKTSVARILAHGINQFDYGNEQGSLDIIEIDAASNRRIDEIRDLREKVHTAPIAGKYKVYIIDEVHMLTREAFNALLKTLEEPPAHAIFILATTEAHKLPETIISRTQHFTFRPVSSETIASHLKNIANQESLQISDDALQLVAQHGRGSFRDSISSLDQLSTLTSIGQDDVLELLGIPSSAVIAELYGYIHGGDIASLVEAAEQAEANGYGAHELAYALLKYIKQQLIHHPSHQDIELSEKLLTVSASSNPSLALQLTLIEFALQNASPEITKPAKSVVPTKTITKNKPPSVPNNKKPTPITSSEIAVKKSKSADEKPPNTSIKPVNSAQLWGDILAKLKLKYNTLYGVARMAEVTKENNELIIKVPYKFHHKKLSDEKNSKIISKIASEVSGQTLVIKVEVKPSVKSNKQITEPRVTQPDTLSVVTQIFGGGEIVES